MTGQPRLHWQEEGQPREALWQSEAGWSPPARVLPADDRITADAAYRLACEGTAIVWRGDFQNARQLLQALSRRVDRPARKASGKAPGAAPPALGEVFHRHRHAQGRRARLLGMLLIEVLPPGRIELRRAPDWQAPLQQAWGGLPTEPVLVALRELLGINGAYEWRRRGVPVPALGEGPQALVHPHYGVFAPVRGEYLDLVAQAPLPPDHHLAWDIGTGTGVIAAVLARRGVQRVVATDLHPRAIACARDNLERLQLAGRVEVVVADLFPPVSGPGSCPLIACNPPWLPARPMSALDEAVYDPEGRMLRSFLGGVAAHLAPGGEAWLIMSDLAEHLGLRAPGELQALIDAGGLTVKQRLDVRPRHPKSNDPKDPLAMARGKELTSLWRLASRSPARH